VHVTGGILLAGTPERLDWLKMAQARGAISAWSSSCCRSRSQEDLPADDEAHFVGAIYDPIEGHVDPYGVTHAYAKAAQLAGAEINRQTRVLDMKQRPDGSWDVVTERARCTPSTW
jgi:dimethylglycine dehydrogenase